MEKTWLKHYPDGVPADVKTDLYPSLVALLEESRWGWSAATVSRS
jgi:long-chain acyl-CoA synthetase